MKHLFALLLMAVCTAVTNAKVYTFEFEGTVIVESADVPGVAVDQPFTGWFNYDDSIAGLTDPLVSHWCSYDQICSAEIHLGDIVFSHMNQVTQIDVGNDLNDSLASWPGDCFVYRFETTVPQFDGDNIICQIFFYDTTATIYNDYSLPTSFDLSSYNSGIFSFSKDTEEFQVFCHIDRINPIPEPASAAIMILGAAVMAVKHRRREKANS